jgi:hypothetical protein
MSRLKNKFAADAEAVNEMLTPLETENIRYHSYALYGDLNGDEVECIITPNLITVSVNGKEIGKANGKVPKRYETVGGEIGYERGDFDFVGLNGWDQDDIFEMEEICKNIEKQIKNIYTNYLNSKQASIKKDNIKFSYIKKHLSNSFK